MTATKAPGILKKMLDIRKELQVVKTGWDEKNQYAYFKADDIAYAVRQGMNEHNVIHHVKLADIIDGTRVDAQGRERSRLTTHSVITFIDTDDGSTFEHEVLASGSDIGGDKAARKTAVQAFKIAAIDLFMVVEGLDTFDSDNEDEAEAEDLSAPAESKAAAASRSLRELDKVVGGFVKDPESPVTAKVLKALAEEIAEENGVEKDSKIWRKDARVMEPLAEILEKAVDVLDKKMADHIDAAIVIARNPSGEVE